MLKKYIFSNVISKSRREIIQWSFWPEALKMNGLNDCIDSIFGSLITLLDPTLCSKVVLHSSTRSSKMFNFLFESIFISACFYGSCRLDISTRFAALEEKISLIVFRRFRSACISRGESRQKDIDALISSICQCIFFTNTPE